MPAVSVAQLLPTPILKAIIGYIPIELPTPAIVTEQMPAPCGPTDLLPLLQVCRSWRQIACMDFYSKAAIVPETCGMCKYKDKRIVRIEDAVASNSKNCIKHVFIEVNMANFNSIGDSHTPSLASIICSHGIIPSVKTVTCFFAPEKSLENGRYDGPESGKVGDNSRMADNMELFSAAIRNSMPNISNVRVYNRLVNSAAPLQRIIAQVVLGSLNKFVNDTQPWNLSLLGSYFINHAASHVTASLQSITLMCFQGYKAEAILIQRNALNLEQIYIGAASSSALTALVWSHHQPSEPIIYPRLKHLVFKQVFGDRNPDEEQPKINLFPRLETLIYCGALSLIVPMILLDCRSSLRHLELEVDLDFLETVDCDAAFAKNAFKNISYVSLSWPMGTRLPLQYDRNLLFTKSVELCSSTHTICLRRMNLENVNRLVANTRFPQTLRYLDLGHTLLDIDETMAILNACPHVLKANLSLTSTWDSSEPASLMCAHVEQYQQKYCNPTAQVKYLGIKSWCFRSGCSAAERIVLLVDILPNVCRVCLFPTRDVSQNMIKDIRAVCGQPAFENNLRLAGVRFCISNCW